MLVYVNNFNLVGANHFDKAFNSVAGWLKSVTGKHFTVDELRSNSEYQHEKFKIRVYTATKKEPYLYSILLTHKDDHVHGRYWSTEISIRLDKSSTFLSILLETQDVSTRVTTIPSSTRPKLVSFLLKNSQLDYDTVGIKPNKITDTTEDYTAFSYEVVRLDRNYPLILVSNEHEAKPLINPKKLQEQLLGLAQVVYTEDEIDSWEMERTLGRKYSAWGGAINIIFPPYKKNSCATHLLLNNDIKSLLESKINLNHHILSIITHKTNAIKNKAHFSPVDVRSKRQKDYQASLKEKFNALEESNDFKELAEEAFTQLEEQSNVIDNINEEHQKKVLALEALYFGSLEELDAAQQELNSKEFKINDLKGLIQQLTSNSKSGLQNENISKEELVNCLALDLYPEQCLRIISDFIPERVTILESAYKSAKEMGRFKNGRGLILKLWRLGNEYLDAFLTSGDSKAKEVFGKSYSAKESETTTNNRRLSSLRKFNYNGQSIEMQRHLKIGVSQNVEQTLRVYFHVDQEEKKIIIGYCGEHLPVSSV